MIFQMTEPGMMSYKCSSTAPRSAKGPTAVQGGPGSRYKIGSYLKSFLEMGKKKRISESITYD